MSERQLHPVLRVIGWLLLPVWVLVVVLVLPLWLVQLWTPPEWWHDLNADSKTSRKVNNILWLQLRLGDWY